MINTSERKQNSNDNIHNHILFSSLHSISFDIELKITTPNLIISHFSHIILMFNMMVVLITSVLGVLFRSDHPLQRLWRMPPKFSYLLKPPQQYPVVHMLTHLIPKWWYKGDQKMLNYKKYKYFQKLKI